MACQKKLIFFSLSLTIFQFISAVFAGSELQHDQLNFGQNSTVAVPGFYTVQFPADLSSSGSPIPMMISIRTREIKTNNR